MIAAAVVCSHPLLLLRELGGLEDPVPRLRSAALHAVRTGLDHSAAQEVVLVGGTDAFRSSPRVGEPAEPLSIRVGRRLLSSAEVPLPTQAVVLPADASPGEASALGRSLHADPRPALLVVMADGSARRLRQAGPGTFDDRAEGVDGLIADSLAVGDPARLGALDPQLSEDLMIAGRAGLQVLSGLTAPATAALTYAQAPYGVGYFVAVWTW